MSDRFPRFPFRGPRFEWAYGKPILPKPTDNLPTGPLPIKRLADPVGKGERGAVITDNIGFRDGGMSINGPIQLDPQLVRSALLFVDRLDYPNREMPLGMFVFDPSDWQGCVDRSATDLQGLITAHRVRRAPYDVFRAHESRQSGAWTIWANEEQSVIPDGEASPDLGFRLEFQNALLVPAADVPIEQILSFKARNRNLLGDLRHHLETLCVKISGEGQDPRLSRIEIEQFDQTLSSYLAEAKRSNFRKMLAGVFTVEMDYSKAVRDALQGAATGSFAAVAGGLTLANAAMLIGGSVATSLTIKSGKGLVKPAPSPFRYIAKAYREFS